MVSESVMNYLMEISIICFVFPVVILMIWRLRSRRNLMPALWGALIFVFFVKLLENIPNALFVGYENPISQVVRANPILYAVYQGILAAAFEETGRFLAFRYFITAEKFDNRQTAITYGIGHGGLECMLILGWTNLQYYMTAVLLNSDEARKEMSPGMAEKLGEQFSDMTTISLVLDGISQLIFFVLQIALSIIVYQAVRNRGVRRYLILYAMWFHFLAYLPRGFYSAGMLPQWLSLGLTGVVLAGTLFLAGGIYRKMGEAEKLREEAAKKKRMQSRSKNWEFAKKKLTNIDSKDE